MHFIISHNCFVNAKAIDFVSINIFEKRGSKAVNMN